MAEAWISGLSDECTRHQEPAGAEERCAGERVAEETAQLWTVAEFVPAAGGDPHDPDDMAAAGPARGGGRASDPAYAESVDHDERAVGQRSERRQWSHGASHHWSDLKGGAGPVPVGEDEGLSGEGQRGGNCAESGGYLAGRHAVRVAAGGGRLRLLPQADGRVRPAIAAVPEGPAEPIHRGEAGGSGGVRQWGGRGQEGAQEEEAGQATQERAGIRSGSGTSAPVWSQSDDDRRGEADDDHDLRIRVGDGYESVENGGSPGVVADAGSAAADQRGQGDQARAEPVQEPGGGSLADGR